MMTWKNHDSVRAWKIPCVLHEPTGRWARQLRGRLPNSPVVWRETRTRDELLHALRGTNAAIVILECRRDPLPALQDLTALGGGDAAPLVLFLDPHERRDVLDLANELGAALATSARTPPPEVAALVLRWVDLARRRLEREGWIQPPGRERIRPPYDDVDALIAECAGVDAP